MIKPNHDHLDPQSSEKEPMTLTNPRGPRAELWPTHWDVVREFEGRYADYRLPRDVACGTIRCMLAIGQQQTHCPIVISRVTGFPLRFVASVVWLLLRNSDWMDYDSGYTWLFEVIKEGNSRYDEIDAAVYSWYESVLHHSCSELVSLPAEWAKCNGIPTEA